MSDLSSCFHAIHPEGASPEERYIFGTTVLLISVGSIILNVLLAVVLCRSAAIEKSVRPHIVSMVAGSLLCLFTNCWILVPTILGQMIILDPYNVVLATPDTVGYLMVMFTTTTMAVDRFLIFFMPQIRQSISGSFLLYIMALIPFSLSMIFTAHMNIIGCRKRVNPYTMSYTYACSECGIYDTMLNVFALAFPGANFVLYFAVFAKIFYLKRSSPRHTRAAFKLGYEIKVVAQFSLICAAQLASSAFFYVLPPLMNGSDTAYHISMVFSTMNTAVNPCVIIVFQSKARHAFRTLIANRKISSSSAWNAAVIHIPQYQVMNTIAHNKPMCSV